MLSYPPPSSPNEEELASPISIVMEFSENNENNLFTKRPDSLYTEGMTLKIPTMYDLKKKGSRASLRSMASDVFSTTSSYQYYSDTKWMKNKSGKAHFFSVLTSLYALFVIVFATVIEIPHKNTPQEWLIESIFYSIMYGLGIIYLIYCYLFIIYPEWYNKSLKFLINRNNSETKPKTIEKTEHTGEGAGSLYLRLGVLLFGSVGIVLLGLEAFICLSTKTCHTHQIYNYFVAALFTFIQMHFLFCNSKIKITGSKTLAKFGLMHLIAVNVWTWFRFILAKYSKSAGATEYGIASASSDLNTYNATTIVSVGKSGKPKYKVASFNYFGDFATLLTTSIIEYSLIAAAVMFVIWKSIDDEHNHQGSGGEHKHHKKKRSKLSVDFGASSGGLFAGVIFLIGSLVTIGIYSYYYQNKETKTAILVFRLSDLTLYCLALIACALAFYQIRHLQYVHSHASNAEFLDELLLFIGTMGEFISCSSGIYCWLISQKEINHMEVYYLFVLIIHLIQVFLQSLLIYLSIRLRALSITASVGKPGRQYITFLLIANVSLFFFHTLESLKSVFGDSLNSERTRPYQYLVAAVLPLSLFYRFHSSVCLAEIWKHCYSVKHQTLTPASSLPTDHSPC